MSFPLHTLLQQPVNGFYKLQSQACLNRPQSPILLQQHASQVHSQAHQTPSPTPQNNQTHNTNDKFVHFQPHTQPQTIVSETRVANAVRTMTSTLARQKSEEDVMSIDSMAQATAGNNIEHPMTLSRKALHQRDADENLFLRFLELDPPTETAAPTNATSATPSAGSGGRRLSATSKAVGRTPFTMTKKLTRTAERGFGFSIVWTHPPRVEKIEPGLSADRAGIQPGDYVIFVDKQNVVTMPEADVLNLIRSQGSTLTLEVFRRTGPTGGVGLGSMPPALSVGSRGHPAAPVMNGKATSSTRLASAASDEQQSVTGVPTIPARRVGVASAVPATNAAPAPTVALTNVRPSTACSGGTTSSIEAAKRRLNLPQVTFSKESIGPITDNRRRLLLQLISREQNFIAALHFGMQRFVQPLQDRKDLISPNDHRTLFQNIDELLRISEDILEQLCNDDQEPQMNFASRVYLSKTTAICAAYKKYCNGIKRADCVLVNKSRQMGSEFVAFITEPQVPRKRPDLTMFIHRPLQHFREILKLMQLLASNCHVDTEEHKNFTTVIAELQAAYREITVSSGLMEPLGEGRPLLTLQDLESRMVFAKCKPFTLAVQGRQWIFGGDLSRVEGRSVKPCWTLLFSDIIVFAKVSRDRVLFITEEPIPIANIVDSCFHMRKKTTEFRLTVDPNGRLAESPTGYCAPDLTRTPKKSARRKSLLLRAPSLELKAVWQNLLQRQIFLVNAALGSTPLSSPLDSPDVLNTLVPLSDIGIATASIGSIKHSSMDSINAKNSQQQVRLLRQGGHLATGDSYENLQRLASKLVASRCSTRMTQTTRTASCSSQTASPARHTLTGCIGGHGGSGIAGLGGLTDSAPSLRSLTLTRRHLVAQQLDARPLAAARAYNSSANNSTTWLSLSGSSLNTQTLCSGEHLPTCKCLTAIPEAACEPTAADTKHDIDTFFLQQRCADGGERLLLIDGQGRYCVTTTAKSNARSPRRSDSTLHTTQAAMSTPARSVRSVMTSSAITTTSRPPKLLEFSLSSVGRSFIDETDVVRPSDSQNPSLTTPDTPTPNISPSSQPCNSDAFSNDFVPTQNIKTQEHEKANKVDLKTCSDTDVNRKIEKVAKDIPLAQFGGSWDLLELDMNLQEVNIDPSYDTDVEECIFMGDEHEVDEDEEIDVSVVVDDPFGVLPTKPTPPDSLDL